MLVFRSRLESGRSRKGSEGSIPFLSAHGGCRSGIELVLKTGDGIVVGFNSSTLRHGRCR